ncbi:MAG: SDR family oxidoreductase, partial [Pseudomonadota bacterium]
MNTKPLALITGAAQGIGYACAEALAEDGAKVILADINSDGVSEAAQKLGSDSIAMTCDMSDPDDISSMFDEIEKTHGPVEILVNNAGVAMPGDFLTYDLASFDRVMDINLRGLFVATQRAARSMV